MYPEENINYGAVSTLIYGVQWDTVLRFIGAYDVGETAYNTYATNSTGMGNYSGTSGDDTFAGLATCGATPSFRQKNIYDIAGNVFEWTMENYGSTIRIIRGGAHSSSFPASYRGTGKEGSYFSYVRLPCCALYKVDLSSQW